MQILKNSIKEKTWHKWDIVKYCSTCDSLTFETRELTKRTKSKIVALGFV